MFILSAEYMQGLVTDGESDTDGSIPRTLVIVLSYHLAPMS